MERKKEREGGQAGSMHANNPSAGSQHLAVLYRRAAKSSRWTVKANAQSKLCCLVDFIDDFFLY